MAAPRGLATVFPRLPLMTAAVPEVSRLLEIRADDAAARRHGRRALLSGLISLAGVGTPAGTLASADVAVLSRAERLILPPTLPAQARARATLAGLLAVIATGPLITAALAASGVLICAT